MTTVAQAYWSTAPGVGELREASLPDPGPGELRVRARFGAISRGTEALVARGEVPPSEHERMRAPFQQGEFPFPVKYGYISVGTVEAGPSGWLGANVFCLHPHQDAYVVPIDRVTRLPDGLPPERAVLTANLETAVNALWDAAPRIGDRITVIGGGAVGCLVAWLAAGLPGSDVQLIDVDASRSDIATRLGARFGAPEAADGDRDLVVHASASEAGLATALSIAGFEATVLELSWFGTNDVAVPLGGAFHANRLTLRASQVGHVATSRRARRDYADRLALVLRLLVDPVLEQLVDAECHFGELPGIMAALARGEDRSLVRRIRYAD